MKIFIASDHAAFNVKQRLLDSRADLIDLGTTSIDRVDYPRFALKLSNLVLANPLSRGILLCGSGIGMSMVANRISGIRAALCRTIEEATLARQHNDANVLCLGARTTAYHLIEKIILKWLGTSFEGGRHQGRIELFNHLGSKPEL